jgi:hypothetical protein
MLRDSLRSAGFRRRLERGEFVEDAHLAWLRDAAEQRRAAEKVQIHRAKRETLGEALDGYADNLTLMIRFAREAGAAPIFVGQTIQWTGLSPEQVQRLWMGAMDGGRSYVKETEMQALIGDFNRRMREVAEREGVPYVDLPAELAGRPDLYYDGCHFNEAGAAAAARVISDYLLAHVLPP